MAGSREAAEWSRTAIWLALYYNSKRKKSARPTTPDDWNPWSSAQERRAKRSGDVVISIPEMGKLWKRKQKGR